jgi:hypothetical protein
VVSESDIPLQKQPRSLRPRFLHRCNAAEHASTPSGGRVLRGLELLSVLAEMTTANRRGTHGRPSSIRCSACTRLARPVTGQHQPGHAALGSACPLRARASGHRADVQSDDPRARHGRRIGLRQLPGPPGGRWCHRSAGARVRPGPGGPGRGASCTDGTSHLMAPAESQLHSRVSRRLVGPCPWRVRS